MGLSYMIAAVALYDEYTNDLLYLREGSCLPRCGLTVILTTIRTSYAKKYYLHALFFPCISAIH
jgi:hypothetical protein